MSSSIGAAVFLGLLAAGTGVGWWRSRRRQLRLERERYIRARSFSASLLASLNERHPHLDEAGRFLVARALRQFFIIHLRAGGRLVAMPSRVVDDLWHAFILDTRGYGNFCQRAFGRFFHHVPAEIMPRFGDGSDALRRAWRLACLEENINPAKPTRLPLLFAIDQKLGIVNGQRHSIETLAALGRGSDGGAGSCGGSGCGGSDGSPGDGGCGGGCGGGD